jgi:hypothetical protein
VTVENREVRVVIGFWRNTYVVPASHPAPEELCGRLDRLAQEAAPEVCAQRLEQALAPDDPSVWLIRELTLEFPMDAGRQAEDRASRAWGEQFSRGLLAAVTREPVGEDVLHFPDRAAFLAQFLSDLVSGRAWGKWYYDEFDWLHATAPGRAIAEALMREPAHAAAAIVRLAVSGCLRDVLLSLTPAEARDVYGLCGAPGGPAKDDAVRAWTGRLLELWNEAPLRVREENLQRDGLWLFGRAAVGQAGAVDDPNLRAALDGLLALRAELAAAPSASALDALVRSAASGGGGDRSPALEFLARTAQGDTAWAAEAAGVLLSEDFRRRAPGVRRHAGQVLLTKFGGLFRLGRSFLESGMEEFAASGTVPAAAVRHAVAVACIGAARAHRAADDPAVRLFTGYEGNWGAAVPCGASVATLLGLLAASGRCRGERLSPGTLMLPSGAQAVLVRDTLQNEWVWAREGESRDAIEEGVRAIAATTCAMPEVIQEDAAEQRAFGWFCSREAPADLSCVLAARAVLRHFSRRLMGFQATGPEYLWANFLDAQASVEEIGDRLEVTLADTPLSLVLRMAGIWTESYYVPWIGREICLRRQSE